MRLARCSIFLVVAFTLGVLTALLWLGVGFHRLLIPITKIIGSFGWQATNDSSKPIAATHAMKMKNLSSKPRLPACGSLSGVWWGCELALRWLSLMA